MLPKSFVPCGGASGDDDTPTASPPLSEPVRSYAIQWTKPFAVGSSTTRTNAAVPSGAPVHARSGEVSSPSQVNWRGIAPPGAKADVVRTKSAMVTSWLGDVEGWPDPPSMAL